MDLVACFGGGGGGSNVSEGVYAAEFLGEGGGPGTQSG
jgi:hypothetical protein